MADETPEQAVAPVDEVAETVAADIQDIEPPVAEDASATGQEEVQTSEGPAKEADVPDAPVQTAEDGVEVVEQAETVEVQPQSESEATEQVADAGNDVVQEDQEQQSEQAMQDTEDQAPAEGDVQVEAETAVVSEETPEVCPQPLEQQYIPPEVGDDYIPVAQLPPLPLPYDTDEEGKPLPLQGVESAFLTGTTIEIIGLSHLGSDKESKQLIGFVPKEDLLKDIQFRGAISDFHILKQKITEADYDPICLQINEDDLFKDGNNFQIALKQEAVDRWNYIEAENARRKQLAYDEEVREKLEKSKPRSQKVHKPKPWISQGSEMEIEESQVRSKREPVTMVLSKQRRDFNRPFKHVDKDAHELWSSSQMECRPFKDPNFDLRKSELDAAVQAVPTTSVMAVQVGGAARLPRPKATQYTAAAIPAFQQQEEMKKLVTSRFLDRAAAQCEIALIQNEVTNIFVDDFAGLADEEALASNRKQSMITEAQSFTHLAYSKNKVVSAIQWLPHRRGVVAVACTEALSHAERVARASRPVNAYILIWNFKDSIHPECVLQAPYEVYAFQYNPVNPNLVAAGCYNGQVVIWDTTLESERLSKGPKSQRHQDTATTAAGDEPNIPIIKYKYASTVDFSHHSVVTDVKWLPGIDVSTKGRISKAADGAKDCSFLATTAGDGKVCIWDIRVERLMKKGRKAEDILDLVWKPCSTLHIISTLGMDLAGSRLAWLSSDSDRGVLVVSSDDGELVLADLLKGSDKAGQQQQQGDASGGAAESTDAVRSITQAHVGPIVSLERSPFFEDIILTVGDWSFQIWREGHTTPLFTSGYAPEMYTCGCWSPSRPALLYVADQGGNLEVWDLLDRSHAPSIRVTLASSAIMSMATIPVPAMATAGHGNAAGSGNAQHVAAAQQAAAQYLALGDAVGTLRIAELPRNLRRPVTNERKLMSVFLEREASRVSDVAVRKGARDAANKILEDIQKKAQEEAEAAIKDQQAGKDQNPTASGVAGSPAKTTAGAGQLQLTSVNAAGKLLTATAGFAVVLDEKAEAEYYKMEQQFKIQLGLVPAETTA